MTLRWCFGVFVSVACAWGQNPLKDYVVSGDSAIGALPPVAVAKASVVQGLWSSDGRYLLVASVVNEGYRPFKAIPTWTLHPIFEEGSQLELQVFDTVTGQTKVVGSLPAGEYAFDSATFLTGSPVAFVVLMERKTDENGKVSDPSYDLARIDASRAEAETEVRLPPLGIYGRMRIFAAPRAPFAMVSVTNPAAHARSPWVDAWFRLDEDGTSTALGEGGESWTPVWTPDGKGLLFSDNRGDPTPTFFSLGVDGIKNLGKRVPHYEAPPKPGTASLVSLQLAAKPVGKLTVTSRALVMTTQGATQPNRAVLCRDADSTRMPGPIVAQISPNQGAVFYVSQGIGFVRPLVTISIEDFVAQLKEAAKQDAMDRARQIGVALNIYSSDNQDHMPDPRMNVASLLAPYLRSPDALDGFVYTCTQTDMTQSTSPSATAVGYVDTPYGRAIIHEDSSVEWRENP